MHEKKHEAIINHDRKECQNRDFSVGETGVVHHIVVVPRDVRGATVSSNLELLCPVCHDIIYDGMTASAIQDSSTSHKNSEQFQRVLWQLLWTMSRKLFSELYFVLLLLFFALCQLLVII